MNAETELTAVQQAQKNFEEASQYARTMSKARMDAEYREKLAVRLREEAWAALMEAQAAVYRTK